MCDRWRDSYAEFLKDVGRKPTRKHMLQRHPNKNGAYEPGNIRWITDAQLRQEHAKPRPWTVYLISNIMNSKVYVGVSQAPLFKRLGNHCGASRNINNNTEISKAIRTLGESVFQIFAIDEAATKEYGEFLETVWVHLMNSKVPNGYNQTDGGAGAKGYKTTNSMRSYLSNAAKKQWAKPGMRKKMCQSMRDSPKTKAKWTPAARKKLSISVRAFFKNQKQGKTLQP